VHEYRAVSTCQSRFCDDARRREEVLTNSPIEVGVTP
jgi:hypothetical protein